MSALDLIANAASGGLLGVIGSFINKGFNVYDNIQTAKAQEIANTHELALYEAQAKLKVIEEENQLMIANNTANAELRSASYDLNFDSTNGNPKVTDFLRLVRPILTFILISLVGVIWAFTGDKSLNQELVDSILFCASSAITWWFGDRASYLVKSRK